MARKNLYINDVNIGTYGIYISSDTYLNSPLIDYSSYNIPAKMGSVLKYNDRFNNVTRKFSCYVPQSGNIDTAMKSLKNLLYFSPGYIKIYSDYETDTYQMGYLAQDIQVKPVKDKTVSFDLYFSCKPQKFNKTNTQFTGNGKTVTDSLYLLPRRYNFIKNILVNVPLEIVPNNSAYVLYMPTAYYTGTYNSVTATLSPNIFFDATSKFVCAFKYTYGNGDEWETYEMTGFLGASDQGTLNLSSVVMNDEAFGIMVPAEYKGDLLVDIDGTSYNAGCDYSGTAIYNTNALGLEALYTFKTYPNPVGTIAQNPIIYIRASDSSSGLGNTLWDGCIEINHHYLQNVYGDSQMRYCWFSIDSETMEAKLKYGTQALGYNTVNASDRISVDGKIGGVCKMIYLYMYGINHAPYDTGYVENYIVDPRWWLV